MRNAALCAGALFAAVLFAAVLTTGCSSPRDQAPTTTATTPTSSSMPTSANATAPADPQPVSTAQCPYLTSDFVAEANGEKVTKVQISADAPHPACFFYSYGNDKQLTVRVYVGDAASATALVDKAAPIASSDKAELPGGWEGGSEATSTGAVYAVAKAGTAVVVTTDQQQTIKAKQVVKQTITALDL